jgi:2-C-methyl-D-erythritol 2,4-cyclodiphosphate synthase
MRVGMGFDVHGFEKGRRLVIGGEIIPFEKGLVGHSDADVLTHAIMDALLGGAGLGDIGKHFPDTDPRFEGISSLKLLSEVGSILDKSGFLPVNIDSVVVAQAPKLAPYIDAVRRNLAEALHMDVNLVSVKATTTEKLGFTGRGEGIAAYAVCLISNKEHR